MSRKTVKLIHEGKFAVEIPVELIDGDGDWAPYLSASDAHMLDAVRKALRNGDVTAASRHGRVYELHPISA